MFQCLFKPLFYLFVFFFRSRIVSQGIDPFPERKEAGRSEKKMVAESTGTAGLGLRGGTHSSSVVPRVATGTAVCGDGGTCGV